MKSYVRVAAGTLVLLAAVGISACAGLKSSTSEQRAEEASLRQRVQARWDAILAEDFEKAHAFIIPSRRASRSVEALRRKYTIQARRKQATIRDVYFAVDDPTRATVVVRQRFDTQGTGGTPAIGTWDELWEKHDGQWWFVRTR